MTSPAHLHGARDAHHRSLYVSYAVEPDDSLPLNHFRFSVTAPSGDQRSYTCDLHNAKGDRVTQMVTVGGTTKSGPLGFGDLGGTTLSFRLNYRGSGRDDIVVPFAFAADVSSALNQQNIHFVWSAHTVQVAGARPLVELDPAGSPIVLSYDVPEPTSYRGRNVIELDLPAEYFLTANQPDSQAMQGRPATMSRRSAVVPAKSAAGQITPDVPPSSTGGQSGEGQGGGPVQGGGALIYGDADPLRGDQAPSGRADAAQLTETAVTSAFEVAKRTGYFDPAVFPNVQTGNDGFSRACVIEALADLNADTVVTQVDAGNRLTIYRDTSGRCTYRFIPVPQRGVPTLLLVEYYRLSSFPARYGAGRTIKTFSLLPGERTRIRVSTYKRSDQSTRRSTSIIDSTSDETESEFERTVLAEDSRQDNTSKSFEYHAEAEAEAKASWGWGSATVDISGGVKGGTNAAREEFAKNISNAVSQNAARASSRRDVQVDTSLDVKLEAGEEEAVERELENVNVSRTLNFVFRQMNQEFVTLLHLVDVRVAFFNGYAESRSEMPLPQLDDLLTTYLVPEKREEVRAAITAELQGLIDYRGDTAPDFIQRRTLAGTDGTQVTLLRVNPDFVSSYRVGADGPVVNVPGIILAADTHVMRTDGVVVDTFLGLGNGLDDYSIGLQTEAVRARQLDNDRQQADNDRVRLAIQIAQSGDAARAAVYQQLFPTPQIVNQIEQAAVNTTPNGRPASS